MVFLFLATFVSLIIVAPLASHVDCTCDALYKVLAGSNILFFFFRVLMLRRKASPTETELRIEYSHMVNEALEMIAVELHTEETSEGFIQSISTDAEAQP